MASKYVNLNEELLENGVPTGTENAPKSELKLQVFQPGEQVVQSAVTNLHFGSQSQLAICPFCNNKVMTSTETKPTNITHSIALRYCFMCLCCCAYWFRCGYKTKHTCPNCRAFLGYYRE